MDRFPALDGTRLQITYSGWGDGPRWRRARSWFPRAWVGALEQQPAAVK